jgi:ribose 5-phosphate isomerase
LVVKAKQVVAVKTVTYISDGMVVGLGTGSTAAFAIEEPSVAWSAKVYRSVRLPARSKAKNWPSGLVSYWFHLLTYR